MFLASRRITRVIKVKCNDKTQIFAKFPSKSNITIYDAEQAYYACHNCPDMYKEDCYLSFGVDRRKVEKYLEIVQTLESTYQKKTIQEKLEELKNNTNIMVTFIHMMLNILLF